MKGDRLLFAAVMLSVSTAPALAAWPYDSIVSFGDSLSDVGDVFIATGGVEPNPPYYMGRFSNGPNWLDDLAQKMNLPLAPILAPGGGTDFAFGGATTGSPDSTNTDGVPTLEQQIGAFNLATNKQASPHALYTFSIGANDLFSLVAQVGGNTISTADASTYAGDAAAVVAGAAQTLQSEGATDLVLFDVPDLSQTPLMQQEAATIESADGVGAADQFLQFVYGLSLSFDLDVTTDLQSVEKAGLTVYDLNTFALIDSVVADPGAYGFSDVNDPCFVAANPNHPFTSGGTECGDPNSYLFWDTVHPTSAAGELIAADAYGKVIPEPSTWAMMAVGFAGLGFAGLRAGRRGQASA